jgi:superoxide dismutase
MPQEIAPIAVRPSTLSGISEQMLVSHYESNYGNAVRTLNAVHRELAALDAGTPPHRLRGLKREELSLMGSVALHELYFGNLGGFRRAGPNSGLGRPDWHEVPDALAAEIAADFGSASAWRREFVGTAQSLAGGSGWVLLTYSRRQLVVARGAVEAVINSLQPVGIRARLRALERAAYLRADQEKGFKRVARIGSAAADNAATRIEACVITDGIRSYGGYPEIDALYREQAGERDAKKREALLHRIQQAMHERVMFAPIVEPAFLNGVGPRVDESALGLITGHLYSAPYEDLRIKPGRR